MLSTWKKKRWRDVISLKIKELSMMISLPTGHFLLDMHAKSPQPPYGTCTVNALHLRGIS